MKVYHFRPLFLTSIVLNLLLVAQLTNGNEVSDRVADIYGRVYKDKYTTVNIVEKYIGRCSYAEEHKYNLCLRQNAQSRGLNYHIDGNSKLESVCCFVWDAVECAKAYTCNPVFEPVLSAFLNDQLRNDCHNYPAGSMACEENRQKYDKSGQGGNQFVIENYPKPKNNVLDKLSRSILKSLRNL